MNFTQRDTFSNAGRWLRLLLMTVSFVISYSPLFSQFLYGTTRSGGTSGGGTIFKTNADGSGFSTEYNFLIDSYPGHNPDYCQMVLIPGTPNKLYGVTPYGGKVDAGVLYEFIPATNSYTVKVDFDFLKGENPFGSLVLASDGKLYGMTRSGGVNYSGTLFQYNPADGTFAKKVDFDGLAKGSAPLGGLTSFNSKLYGMTANGGTNGFGVIFEFNPTDGTYNKKFDFDGLASGSYPFRNLTVANGKLYGMTFGGGLNDKGVLFEFDPSGAGTVTKKFDFGGAAGTGEHPVGSLLLSTVGLTNGHLIGTTNLGGSNNGAGILFEYIPGATTIAKRVDFDGGLNTIGASPGPALVQVTNGTIYGFCEAGGINTAGTMFAFKTDGTAAKIFDFGGATGYGPKGGMTLVGSLLYGTAAGGGQTESGVIFSLDPATTPSAVTKLLDFNLAGNGAYPENSMVLAPNGKLYGMTPDGGTNGWGVLFEFDPISKTYAKKVDFDNAGTKGANPYGSLALGPDGRLYGMTSTGGIMNQGTLFVYDPATSTLTKRVDFDKTNSAGIFPYGGLVYAPSTGKFYGMARNGGIDPDNGYGTIFEWDYNNGATYNMVTKKVDFDGGVTIASKGAYPYGNLTLSSNGKLYGMTSQGGQNNLGVLFEFAPVSGTFTKTFDFDGQGHGAIPNGGLVLGSDDKFYGLTSNGGQSNFGVIFQCNNDGTGLVKKQDINGPNVPLGTLVMGANGKLYGTSWFGGALNYGNVFEYDPVSDALTIKQELTGSNGAYPGYGSLAFVRFPPGISSFSPASGPVGTSVTINGTNFDPTPDNNIVYFGATRATVAWASKTKLIVIVPIGATYQPITVNVSGLIGYSRLSFLVTFPAAASLGNNSLASPFTPSAAFVSPTGIAVADFDNDGRPDIAVTDYGSTNVLVFKNTSVGSTFSFANPQPITTQVSPRNVSVGDLDGNGQLDMVVNNQTVGTFTVALNHSTASTLSFNTQLLNAVTAGANPWATAMADLDGDGRAELVATNSSSASVSVFYFTFVQGNINTAVRTEFATGLNPEGIGLGDIDGDGKIDIVVSNYNAPGISVLRNTSKQGPINSGSFAPKVDFATTGGSRSVSLGDVDGDGKVDILVANDLLNSVSVFRNLSSPGAITLAKTDLSGYATGPYAVGMSDIDGDGKPEFAASLVGGTNAVAVQKNTSSGSVSGGSVFSFAVNASPTGIAFADLNLDGKNDLVSVSLSASTVQVLGNNIGFLAPSITSFEPPIDYRGGSAYITGTNFSAIPTENEVRINGFVAVVDSASATELWITVPADATTGKITAKVHNQTATSTNDIIIDLTPAVISSLTPTSVPSSVTGTTTLTATVTDPESPDYVSVSVTYGPANEDTPALADMNMNQDATNHNLWTLDIGNSQNVFKNSGLRVKIQAYSGGGYSEKTFLIGTTHSDGSIPYGAHGTAVANYRMVAVPFGLVANTVDAVFGDELGPYGDKKKWRMYHYAGTIQELGGTSQLLPGQGYWFIAATDDGPFSTGSGVTVGSVDNPVTIQVSNGWNQIGNPYTFKLSIADVTGLPANSALGLGTFKTYTGTYNSPTQMDAYQGGFLFSNTAGTLTFPGTRTITSGRTAEPIIAENKNAIDQSSWQVTLHLTDSNHSLDFGGFGMHPQASLSFDTWDDFTVPRFIEYLELDHAKKLYGYSYTKDMVPTAENYEWTFDAESSQEGVIEMSWDNTYFGDNDRQLILWDVQQQIPTNMREQKKYTINPSAGNSFKVFFGDKDYVKEKAMPNRMVFHTVFPNPSEGKFTFAFSTTARPEDQWVSLEVVDMLGRKVTTITEGNYTPGYHEVTWDAVDPAGAPLSGGIYLTRLKNSATEIPKKIVLK